MTCDYCHHIKDDGGGCHYCETHWESDLRDENEEMPHSILEKIRGLPLEDKKKIYTLGAWQYVRQQEWEYGFALQVANGDEKNKEVIKQRKNLEKVMQGTISEVSRRYGEVIEGRPKTKTPVQQLDYLHIRYGKNF